MTAAGLRDTANQIQRPLWQSWYFLTLYANAAGTTGRVRAPGEASTDLLANINSKGAVKPSLGTAPAQRARRASDQQKCDMRCA